jgi:hypothetical protein
MGLWLLLARYPEINEDKEKTLREVFAYSYSRV